MQVRQASAADEPAIRALWEAFNAEIPEPIGDPETWEDDRPAALAAIARGDMWLAEEHGEAVGLAWMGPTERRIAFLDLAYVVPQWRGRGVIKALLARAVAKAMAEGAEHVTLEVLTANRAAAETWSALGFEEIERTLAVPAAALQARLAR